MRIAALLVAVMLGACGTMPHESFYTLSAEPATLPATATGPSVYVHRVSVPETVDRTPMVVRTGPNQVEVEDFHRWAEPLKTAIPRVLADHLMRELGSTRVRTGRQGGSPGEFDYRVAVEVTRFESSLADGAVLEANWTVIPKSGPARTGRSVLREAGAASHAGIAAAHSRALAALARDIAAALK